MNALVYVLEMRNEKNYAGFSYYKNIANFEAFWRDKIFSKNLLFLGSENFLIFHSSAIFLRDKSFENQSFWMLWHGGRT